MIKSFIKKIISAIDLVRPSESIEESKKKWDLLAQKNAKYYVLSDQGEDISEDAFKNAGEADYKDLVLDDQIVKEKIGISNAVLEIGCGIGRMTEFFSKDFGSVYAIDISKSMIERARERLKKFEKIKFIETNGVSYPFDSSVFDLVFSFIVFQHMPDKETIIKNINEVGRVLKRGGIAKIQFRGIRVAKGSWFYGPAVTPKEINDMAQSAGMKMIKQSDSNKKYYWVWFQK